MRINHGSISIAAGSPGIMITAFQEWPQFTIKCTSCRIVGCDILQCHLASAACTTAFFVCVVRKKLLLENEFPTQAMFMHPGLPGETVAYFWVLLHTFFCCCILFLLLHKSLCCCYLFFIVACLFLLLVIFFYCCKPKIVVAIGKLSLHASGRFGPP